MKKEHSLSQCSRSGVRSEVASILRKALGHMSGVTVVRGGPDEEVTFGVDLIVGYMDDEPRRGRCWFRAIVKKV